MHISINILSFIFYYCFQFIISFIIIIITFYYCCMLFLCYYYDYFYFNCSKLSINIIITYYHCDHQYPFVNAFTRRAFRRKEIRLQHFLRKTRQVKQKQKVVIIIQQNLELSNYREIK